MTASVAQQPKSMKTRLKFTKTSADRINTITTNHYVPIPKTEQHHQSYDVEIKNKNKKEREIQAETNKASGEDYKSRLEASKRKLHEGYEAAENAKKAREIVLMDKPKAEKKKKRHVPAGKRFVSKKLQKLYEAHETYSLVRYGKHN